MIAARPDIKYQSNCRLVDADCEQSCPDSAPTKIRFTIHHKMKSEA
jgi:hypothetical protein